MKYGYMPSFGKDIISEIRFAKKFFDFIEITYNLDESYTVTRLKKIKRALGEFPTVGHLHWDLDFSTASEAEIKKALKQLSLFDKLGVKKITIHPSPNCKLGKEAVIRNNIAAFNKLKRFCTKKKQIINIENTLNPPFNKPLTMRRLFTSLKSFRFTFDTGHAAIRSALDIRKFLRIVGKKPSHVHLSNTVGNNDHLPFTDKKKLCSILSEIKNVCGNPTVTFEIFYSLHGRKKIALQDSKRRKLLLWHLRIARKYSF